MTNEELVRRRVEAINTGDFEALGEVLAHDVITHYGSGEAVHGSRPWVVYWPGSVPSVT